VIICDSRRFVFVHVQKTGGSAVTKLLKPELPDEEIRTVHKRHAPLGRILDKEPDLFDHWIFGFVRGTEELPRLGRPQIRYLQAGGRRADFIGRTETLGEDVATAMAHVGLSADALDHHNRGERDPSKYRHYYSDASGNGSRRSSRGTSRSSGTRSELRP
jgi:hypothetical protein